MRIDRLLLVCFILLILIFPSYQNINGTEHDLKNDTFFLSENKDNNKIYYPILSNELSKKHPKTFNSHPPIYIIGNDDFTPENGVIGGNGTEKNPYIIEGWEIRGNLFWKMVNKFLYHLECRYGAFSLFVNIPITGIYLEDTDKHVVIRNNYIHDWMGKRYMLPMAGITTINASNVTIENNIFEDNGIGIHIANCRIIREIRENYTTSYIKYYNSTNINIKFNEFIGNGDFGIDVSHAYNSSITYNNISLKGSTAGIDCSYTRLYIAHNNIFYNGNGIICAQTDYSFIENNIIIGNGKSNGIYCAESVPGEYIGSNPTITNNIISENAAGIFICKNYPTISNNTITHSIYGIMNMGESKYATVIIDNIISNNNFGISYWGCALIEHNLISSNIDGVGVVGNATVRYNIVSSNTLSGIACAASEIGGKIYAPIIHYNNIFDNRGDGIHYGETIYNVTINATYNYWGSPDGPSGYGNGTGDEVDKNIIFEPWLVEPYPKAGPR